MFWKNKTKRSASQNEMFFFRFPHHNNTNASDFSGAFVFSKDFSQTFKSNLTSSLPASSCSVRPKLFS